MARVTVEDCIEKVPSRFELVVVAARRAKQIAAGSPLTIDRDNDKDSVVSLREIAEETVDVETLEEDTIQSFRRRHASEEFVAAPFADEIEDEMAAQAQEMVDEESTQAPEATAMLDAPEGMSFDDENIDVEDE